METDLIYPNLEDSSVEREHAHVSVYACVCARMHTHTHMHTNKDFEDRLLKQCLNLSTYWASAKRADPVLQVVEEANTGGRATVPRATTVFISTVH